MLKTDLLGLPIYDNPSTDLFKLQDWNDANKSLEASHKDLTRFRDELPKINANAEIIDARGGKPLLADRLREMQNKSNNNIIASDIQPLETENVIWLEPTTPVVGRSATVIIKNAEVSDDELIDKNVIWFDI